MKSVPFVRKLCKVPIELNNLNFLTPRAGYWKGFNPSKQRYTTKGAYPSLFRTTPTRARPTNEWLIGMKAII